MLGEERNIFQGSSAVSALKSYDPARIEVGGPENFFAGRGVSPELSLRALST